MKSGQSGNRNRDVNASLHDVISLLEDLKENNEDLAEFIEDNLSMTLPDENQLDNYINDLYLAMED
jgi:hypothetical protein